MAKNQYIRDLKHGDVVDSVFLVKSKRLAPFKSKPGNYWELLLEDYTATMDGRIWDNAERFESVLNENVAVRVKGQVDIYQDKLQVRIFQVEPAPTGAYELEDLLPHTNKDVEKLAQRLLEASSSLTSPHLRALVSSFLEDEEFMQKLKRAPASVSLHHAYLGGLIEHTVAVVEVAEAIASLYPQVDRELLLTGAILHDIGKIREYQWMPSIEQTDEGRLIGHVVFGDQMVAEKISQMPDFPAELAARVRHMVLSQHGSMEWGSPKVPMTIEAMALHLVENLDAQIQQVIDKVESGRIEEKVWTEWDRKLERRLFVGRQERAMPPTD